jgi:hypothetical protein
MEPDYFAKEVSFHNQLWWWFQVINLVPSSILWFYQFRSIFSYKNVRYEVEYHTDDFIEDLKKKDILNKMTVLKTGYIEYYWKAYIACALLYYVADTYYLVANYNLMADDKICELAMTLHHIATVWGILPSLFLPYYPWFFTFVFSTHCYLIKWPYYKVLHLPYSMALIYFLCRLFTRPFRKVHLFRRIIHCLPLLAAGLLTYSFNQCQTNDLRY